MVYDCYFPNKRYPVLANTIRYKVMVIQVTSKMVRDIEMKTNAYPTAAWPMVSLPCPGLACGLTNVPDHCILEPECIFNGLVHIFCDFGGYRLSSLLSSNAYRQTFRKSPFTRRDFKSDTST